MGRVEGGVDRGVGTKLKAATSAAWHADNGMIRFFGEVAGGGR